ncbi:lipoyltransferase [Auricularia subglabra TFB-10046 SS5]|nr:lipoyltransferase [Auricularia subglabra TFB-10046 SS5]
MAAIRPPVLYHYFRAPVPYLETLALQEKIHARQLRLREAAIANGADIHTAYPDVLLLLQHRPVFTAGRRMTAEETAADQTRLTSMGADFVLSNRGGQLTYHGPGQLVGYPLWDLSRNAVDKTRVRTFVCDTLSALKRYMRENHGIQSYDSDDTGVFLNATTKLASLGMQVRHRLTSHGFAFNITPEPLAWFSHVVACGAADVRAGCVQDVSKTGKRLTVEGEIPLVLDAFAAQFERTFAQINLEQDGDLEEDIRHVDRLGKTMSEQGIPPPPIVQ